MKKFKLLSRTNIFIVKKEYLAAGFIPSVQGISLCGKYQTFARIVDVEFITEVQS